MYIPLDKIEIPIEKITNYLLVPKKKNDKSGFLLKLGYTIENWQDLANDVKRMVADNEAILQQNSPFGKLFEIRGKLKNFGVVTIWLLATETEKYKFITLFPE